MLNINRGHNEKLKEMCKSLKDYSEYTERVREYAQIKPVEEAVEQAISECIQEGIMAEFLKQNRAEAKQVSIYEYDEEKHMRQEREASWEEGRENINRGHNEKLKEMCKSLKDYSEYTERVREYAQIKPVEEAVEQAISECIQEGIMAEFLKQNRAEAKQVSIYEYDEEKHMRQEREASWEEGREEGIEEGIKKGKQELLERLIQKKLVKGKSISEIAEELEEEEEVIAEMIQKSVGARK